MLKLRFLVLILILFTGGCVSLQKPDSAGRNPHEELALFKKDERILILAPHPDDEVIACGGIIQKALKAGAQVKVAYLTNGEHNELAFIVYEKRITFRQGEFIYLGELRQKEATQAMDFLGVPEKNLVFLGYPDYGTFEIFCKYWRTASGVTAKPFRDRLTRISSVPYRDNPSYGTKYYGENVLSDLTKLILDYQPHKIFVSHPADVNVDHKTFYLFLQVALSELEGRIAKPIVYPYLVHCLGWPKPRHYHPELELHPPDKFNDSRINWQSLDLSQQEIDKKYRALLFYKSQTQSSGFYLFSFIRKNELFSDYPPLELKPQSASEARDLFYFDATQALKEEYSLDEKQADVPEDKGFVSYTIEDGYFLVHLGEPQKFSRGFGVMLYIFGYSQKTPFAQMPKIRIITAGENCKVFNFKNRLIDPDVSVDLDKNSLVIRVPLKLLGQPDYVLTALKAYHGNLPADVGVFRKVQIK